MRNKMEIVGKIGGGIPNNRTRRGVHTRGAAIS